MDCSSSSSRAARMERKAESLDHMVCALPWWIRRVGQRRMLERCFFKWRLCSLRKWRRKKKPQPPPTPSPQQTTPPISEDFSAPPTSLTSKKCTACSSEHIEEPSRRRLSETPDSSHPKRKAWGAGTSNGKGEYHNSPRKAHKRSSPRGLQAVQGSLQKELHGLEAQIAGHMRMLERDQGSGGGGKGPVWKGSWSSTLEVCNKMMSSIADARKLLDHKYDSSKEEVKVKKRGIPRPQSAPSPVSEERNLAHDRHVHDEEQLLDFPGGFRQKMEAVAAAKAAAAKDSPRSRKAKIPKEVKRIRQHPACNLMLEPGTNVNVSCEENREPKPLPPPPPPLMDIYRGRICTAAQYAEYLREEIRRLKLWQAGHEADIQEKLHFDRSGLHPELEILI